jgi:hypothetical protein
MTQSNDKRSCKPPFKKRTQYVRTETEKIMKYKSHRATKLCALVSEFRNL